MTGTSGFEVFGGRQEVLSVNLRVCETPPLRSPLRPQSAPSTRDKAPSSDFTIGAFPECPHLLCAGELRPDVAQRYSSHRASDSTLPNIHSKSCPHPYNVYPRIPLVNRRAPVSAEQSSTSFLKPWTPSRNSPPFPPLNAVPFNAMNTSQTSCACLITHLFACLKYLPSHKLSYFIALAWYPHHHDQFFLL